MDAVRDFDYGAYLQRVGKCSALQCLKVRCMQLTILVSRACSCSQSRKPARGDSQQHQRHHHGRKAPRVSADHLRGTSADFAGRAAGAEAEPS